MTLDILTLDIMAYEASVELMIDLRKHTGHPNLNAVLVHLLTAPPPRMSAKAIRVQLGARPWRIGTHVTYATPPLVSLRMALYRQHMDAWDAYLRTQPYYGPAGSQRPDPTQALDRLICRAWIARARPARKVA